VKVPVSGAPPVQVTTAAGAFAIESTDGHSLYFSKHGVPGIWRMPLNGGEQTRVLDQPDFWWDWALTQNGTYFIRYSSKPPFGAALEFFDFATSKIVSISTWDKPSQGLALSPDGRSILYSRQESSEGHIMIVKHFR
jgi:hypothetical protein